MCGRGARAICLFPKQGSEQTPAVLGPERGLCPTEYPGDSSLEIQYIRDSQMVAPKAVAGTGDNAGIFITLSTSNLIIEVTVAMYIFAH